MVYEFKDTTPRPEALAQDGYYRDWEPMDAGVFHDIVTLSKYIREKGLGSSVREAIAQAVERTALSGEEAIKAAQEVKQSAEGLTQQFDNMIQATTGKDIISAPEIIESRKGEMTLNQRLEKDAEDLTKLTLRTNQFGVKGDGTDDSIGLSDAFSAIENGGKLTFDASIFTSLRQNLSYTLKDDVEIDFNGSTLSISDTFLLNFQGEPILDTTLVEDTLLQTNKVSVASVANIKLGDIIYISNSTIAETDWNTTKRFTSTVVAITGNTLLLKDKIHFDFLLSESGNSVSIWRPHKLTIKNATIKANATTNKSQFRLHYLTYNMENIKIDITNNAYAFELTRCVDGIVRNVEVLNGGYYPFLVSSCRNARFYQMNSIGKELRHMVAFSGWTADGFVDGLYGLGGLVESHPAFNINYQNVDITTTEANSWNLRSVGGSIKNARIKHTGSPPPYTLLQSVNLRDERLWNYTKMVLDDVELDTVASNGLLEIRHGRDVEILNCKFPEGTVLSIGNTVNHGTTTKKLKIHNTSGIVDIENRAVGFSIITDDFPGEKSFSEGIHHIRNLNKTIIRSDNEVANWKDSGVIVSNESHVSPFVSKVRFYPQNKNRTKIFNYVLIKLKLTGIVTHSNSGMWDMVEQTYFGYMGMLNEVITITDNPVDTKVTNSIANSDLSMAIGNIDIYSLGETEGSKHYFGLDVTLSTARSNPKFSLLYDIEYFGYGV